MNQDSALFSHFKGLSEPVAVSFGLFPTDTFGNKITVTDIVDTLRQNGFDAVSADDKKSADNNKIAVVKNGVYIPFLKPDDAYAFADRVVKALQQKGIKIKGFVIPLFAGKTTEDIPKDRVFIKAMLIDALKQASAFNPAKIDAENIQGQVPSALFRGGQYGADAFGVSLKTDKTERNFVYASPKIAIAANYAYGDTTAYKKVGGISYGFIYMFSVASDQEYFTALIAGRKAENGAAANADETWVFPNENKHIGTYLLLKDRFGREKLFEIPKEGKEAEKWKLFLNMHNAYDNRTTGNMAKRFAEDAGLGLLKPPLMEKNTPTKTILPATIQAANLLEKASSRV